MFGGAGIYIDGLFVAIVDKDVLYFKTDEATRRAFDAEGMGTFVYDTKHGPGELMSYRRAPERLLDDGEEMAEWARRALAVARRAAAGKAKRKRRPV
jgi:DNA transformation protein